VALSEQEALSAISVSDLVRHARVGRSTFYRRHVDLRSFLETLQHGFFAEVSEAFRGAQQRAGADAGTYPVAASRIRSVVTVVGQEAEFVRAMCHGPDGFAFQTECCELAKKLLSEDFSGLDAAIDNSYCPSEYVLAFLSEGIVGALSAWLANPTPESIDDTTFYLVALMSGGTRDFLT
jgi:AcrR family transcriptional regulator